ncbi:hypothetical protein D9M68_747540 [compost metagenome]
MRDGRIAAQHGVGVEFLLGEGEAEVLVEGQAEPEVVALDRGELGLELRPVHGTGALDPVDAQPGRDDAALAHPSLDEVGAFAPGGLEVVGPRMHDVRTLGAVAHREEEREGRVRGRQRRAHGHQALVAGVELV